MRFIKTAFKAIMLNEEDYPSDEETSDEEYMPSGKYELVVFTQTIKIISRVSDDTMNIKFESDNNRRQIIIL